MLDEGLSLRRWAGVVGGLVAAVVCSAPIGHAQALQTPAFSPAPAQGRMDPTTDPPQADPMPVEREYDRFQDKTTVRVEGIRPAVTRGESRIFISATSSCEGPEVNGKPEKVTLSILAVSDEFQFVDARDALQFILLIDNQRVRVPAKFVKAGMTRDSHNPKTLETFTAVVEGKVLASMVTADIVEAQLGATEIKLGVVEQLSLRRFAETVNLLAPLPKPAATALDAALSAGPVRADAIALHLAQAKVDEAQEKVDRLMAASLARLDKSDAYQAAVKAARELEVKKDQTPAGPQRGEISQQWLEAKAKMNLIKSSALLEDAELAAARRDLADAQTAVKGLQRTMERSRVSAGSH
jgi:hypothetical protein